jgi:exosortase/archaeosortase family protein
MHLKRSEKKYCELPADSMQDYPTLLLPNGKPTTNRASPINIQICARTTRSNKYKTAPIHRTKMPIRKILETVNQSPRKIVLYFLVVAVIISVLYYLPNYFFLEKATAEHTAFLLNYFGIQVEAKVIDESVFLENIKVVKDCTGIQVIAVFFGLIIPLPKAQIKKKVLAVAAVSIILYAANLLRISLEFVLVYLRILPWSLAHYPLSLLLGIVGVSLLFFVSDRLLPEFGEFLFSVRSAFH